MIAFWIALGISVYLLVGIAAVAVYERLDYPIADDEDVALAVAFWLPLMLMGIVYAIGLGLAHVVEKLR